MFRKTQLFHKNLLRRIVLLLTLMVVLVSCLPKKTNTVNENYNEVEGGLVIGEMSVSQRKAAEDLTQKSEGNAEVFVENGVVHSMTLTVLLYSKMISNMKTGLKCLVTDKFMMGYLYTWQIYV